MADVVYTANQRQGNGAWTTAATLTLAAGESISVSLSDRANGYVIADAVRLVRTDAAHNRLTWPLGIEVAGDYRLEARWTSHPNRASNATYVVQTSSGPQAVTVNQRQGGGVWQPLGTFSLDATSAVVLTDEADGYVIADGIRVVWVDSPNNQQTIANSGSQIVYVHNDHLGTPQVITDQNQEIVWQGEYLPFGEVTTTTAAIENPIRFPGQYYDEETGTYYNYFRDYEPTLGRYIQSDPIGVEGGLATYSYAAGNPVAFIDSLGLAYSSYGEHGMSQREIMNLPKENWTCVQQCFIEAVQTLVVETGLALAPTARAIHVVSKALGVTTFQLVTNIGTANCVSDCTKKPEECND